MKFEAIELSLSDNEKQYLEYQQYLVNTICKCYGIPAYLIKPNYKETIWQRIKRNVKSFLWRSKDKMRRKESFSAVSESSLRQAIYWTAVYQRIRKIKI